MGPLLRNLAIICFVSVFAEGCIFSSLEDDLELAERGLWTPFTFIEAGGMYQFLEVLHQQHDFDELHIVAHSMGGLVLRGSINLCAQNRRCDYLSSYATISTPWNGVESAKNSVKWAPTAVPVWHNLDPGSEYITTLFDTGLPDGLTFHLLFGYQHDSMFDAIDSSSGG